MVWTADLDEKVAELRKQGLSYTHIAARLGLTRNMLIGRADRLRRKESGMTFTCKKVGRSRRPIGVLVGRLRIRESEDFCVAKCHSPSVPSGIPIYELERNECRWPTGESSGIHLFCAHRTDDGKVYCAGHEVLARQKNPRPFMAYRFSMKPWVKKAG
jgi:hypothetical protein